MVSKTLFSLLLSLASIVFGFAQKSLSLDSCINQANRNFAFAQQIDYNQQIADLNIKKLGKGYLPSLDFNAVSTYQNQQIEIPVAIPGFDAPVSLFHDEPPASFPASFPAAFQHHHHHCGQQRGQ